MATFIMLMGRRRDIVAKLFENASECEDQRAVEYAAAVKIQSWFRGTRVRSYIRYLSLCARTIQRHYRGSKGREVYRQTVKEHVAKMRITYYNCQAVKIQKVWKGYYTRKFIHNFYSRKAYLNGLLVKNAALRDGLHKFALSTAQEAEIKKTEKEKSNRIAEAEKTHYLISTHQIPGIYNSQFLGLSPKEIELRAIKPLSPKSRAALSARLRTGRSKTQNDKEITIEYGDNMKYKPLPPINTPKIQGPFRTPEEVWQQRYKSLNPTLRVATAYDSPEQARVEMKAKEWVTRLIDDKFVPFTHRICPYDPLLHTNSAYGSLPYGSKHFREENPSEHISNQRFKTVVSPIPIFDEFGKTY